MSKSWSLTSGRSRSAILPGFWPGRHPRQERKSSLFLSRPLPASTEEPSGGPLPRVVGTRDPRSEESREGARGGAGVTSGREGHLQKGRGCRSVAGGRLGKIGASPTSAPELCYPGVRVHARRGWAEARPTASFAVS